MRLVERPAAWPTNWSSSTTPGAPRCVSVAAMRPSLNGFTPIARSCCTSPRRAPRARSRCRAASLHVHGSADWRIVAKGSFSKPQSGSVVARAALGVALVLGHLDQRLERRAQRGLGAASGAPSALVVAEHLAAREVRVVRDHEHVAAGARVEALGAPGAARGAGRCGRRCSWRARRHDGVPEDDVAVDHVRVGLARPLVADEGREAAGGAAVVEALRRRPGSPARAPRLPRGTAPPSSPQKPNRARLRARRASSR